MSQQDFDYKDDGRTIADMSGLERPSLFGTMFQRKSSRRAQEPSEAGRQQPQSPPVELTPKQRRITILAAVSAGVVTALIYIVVLGLVTLLLLWLWT